MIGQTRHLKGRWYLQHQALDNKNANAGDEKKRVKRKMAIVIGFIGTRPVWAIFVEACLLVPFCGHINLSFFNTDSDFDLLQCLLAGNECISEYARNLFPNKNSVCFPCVFCFLVHENPYKS